MKTIIKVTLASLILLLTATISTATSGDCDVFDYCDPDITIAFENGNNFSQEIKQRIANSLAGLFPMEPISGESPHNIICTIFGHDLKSGTVSVTHHKAAIHDPRCKKDYYDVTACTRCDYSEEVFLGGYYISCCPEDLIN